MKKCKGCSQETTGSHLVTNDALGINFVESRFSFSRQKQIETGVLHVQRRVVTEISDGSTLVPVSSMWEHSINGAPIEQCRAHEILSYLTDGRYPSHNTWNHAFLGDYVHGDRKVSEVQRYCQEVWARFADLAYLQRIDTKTFRNQPEHIDKYWHHYFGEEGGRFQEVDTPTNKRLFNMSFSIGLPVSHDYYQRGYPLFIFGCRNRIFREYIEQIKQHPEASIMAQETLKKHSIDSLLADTDCQEPGHPFLPVVYHPDIRPLRWCHAEIAVIPTRKALNVLFFETESE